MDGFYEKEKSHDNHRGLDVVASCMTTWCHAERMSRFGAVWLNVEGNGRGRDDHQDRVQYQSLHQATSNKTPPDSSLAQPSIRTGKLSPLY